MHIDNVVKETFAAFTEDAAIKGEGYKQQRIDKQAKVKKNDTKKIFEVTNLFNSLFSVYKQQLPVDQARKKSLAITAQRLDMPLKKIQEVIK